MYRCLQLASQGRGKVGNGALVGAVLVRNNTIISEGFHAAFGAFHAERTLLTKFSEPITSDDTLYVNFEPCCHNGKTPPCTDIILERGIRRVVYGIKDPDPRVMGKGIELLQSHGISIQTSRLMALCEYMNRGFINVRKNHRPFITLKQAHMPSGSIANADGSPLKITFSDQDDWAHTYLRERHDAILVGIKTILMDDPSLTIRYAKPTELNKNSDQYIPYRIVLDPHLKIQEHAKLVTDSFRHKTIIIYCSETADFDQHKRDRLQKNNVHVWSIDMRDGSFDWSQLWSLLLSSNGDFHGITSVLIEGGRRTWDLFRRNGFVDEEVTLLGVE